MEYDEFVNSIEKAPLELEDPILKSLYLIKQDKWDDAHVIVQDLDTKMAECIHGLLHEIEGDHWNASYWYRRSGFKPAAGTIDQKWEEITRKYLKSQFLQ